MYAEREEKEDEEIKIMRREIAEDDRRLTVVKARITGGLKGEDAEFEDMGALEGEANELQDRINTRYKKIDEYLERRFVSLS